MCVGKNKIDLFTPVVERAKWHPYFQRILDYPNGFDCDVLNSWAEGFVDRDGKFVKEFQTTFNSSFWELYLFSVLKFFNLNVDFSFQAPDFFVDKSFCLEAVVSLHAEGDIPEFETKNVLPPTDLNEFNRQTILRLSNAFVTKHKKYIDRYCRLDHVKDKPFVIAVANFDRPFFFLSSQRPIEALLHGYYVDEEEHLRENRIGQLEKKQISHVSKNKDVEIPLGLFQTEEYSAISAVIYSACAGWGKVRALSSEPDPPIVFQALRYNPHSTSPHIIRAKKCDYSENLVDGLRVYHNPYADKPLAPSIFRSCSVFQSYFEKDDLIYELKEGQLLSRSLISLLPK